MACNCQSEKIKDRKFTFCTLFVRSIFTGMILMLGYMGYLYTLTLQSGISRLAGSFLFGGLFTTLIVNNYDIICVHMANTGWIRDPRSISRYTYLAHDGLLFQLTNALYLVLCLIGNLIGTIAILSYVRNFISLPELVTIIDARGVELSNLNSYAILTRSFVACLLISFAYNFYSENKKVWNMIIPLSIIALFSLTPIILYLPFMIIKIPNVVFSITKLGVCLGGCVFGCLFHTVVKYTSEE